MKEIIEELRREAEYAAHPDIDGYSQDGLACRLNAAADAIERLENEAVAASIRMDNDAAQLRECRALLGDALQESTDGALECTLLKAEIEELKAYGDEQTAFAIKNANERDEWKARAGFGKSPLRGDAEKGVK